MKLGQMFPGQAKKHASHADATNTVLSGKGRHAGVALGEALTNFNHLLFGEFGNGVFGSDRVAFLSYLVGYIIGVCSQEQVVGILAGRMIATMQNMKPIGDWAVCQFPRNTVGRNNLVIDPNLSVSLAAFVSLPLPTVIGAENLYLCPEMLHEGWSATEASVMPMHKANGLTFDLAAFARVSCRNLSLFAATTAAITVRNILRGIMGLHRNLPFCAKSQGVPAPLGQLFSSFNYTIGGAV